MPGDGTHKRKKDQREQDLAVVAELYLKGKRQVDIANHLAEIRPYTLTQQQISADLKTIRKRWLASSLRDFDELQSEELAKVERLEITYWEAWERSLEDRERRETSRTTGETARDSAKMVTQAGLGDPRYLTGIQWCITKRCEILGLNAPQKVAPTMPDGRQPYVLTESERMERLTELLSKAVERAKAEGQETQLPQMAPTDENGF